MEGRFPAAFAIGIAVIGVAVGAVFFMQRGARVGLTGKIAKVRTAPLDERSSVAVLDFSITNPSDYAFAVRQVTVVLDSDDGRQYNGETISEMDAKRLFEGIPLLGQKFNDTLLMRDKILPKSSVDRMVSARFA